jgi:hypothetical protein
MVTILGDGGATKVAGASGNGGALWVPLDAVEQATGWQLKPEGLCRDEICVPAPPARKAEFVRPDAVNLAAFWQHMGRPALHDATGETWVLGDAAGERAAALDTLEAPDFTLPDLNGKLHSLSDHRGRKVVLTTWASW